MTSLTVNPESNMKTSTKFILAALACVMSASCQKDAGLSSDNTATEQLTLSTEVLTKTSLNGNDIHWTSDDEVAVFDNTDRKNLFTASATDGSYAEFTGEVTSGTTSIYAVYPYSLAVSANAGVLKVNVPADQTSKAGSFAEEHNISVAKAEKSAGTTAVTFKNACALLKFTVPAYLSDVQKVTLSSNSVIAGEMTVDYTGDVPASTLTEEGCKSISMTGDYAAGSTFWFVLAPVTLDGITVNVETAQGTYSMSTDSQFEMTAGNYKNLGTLELKKVQMTSATAAHTYSEGVLTGTQVSVNLGINQTTAAYITALTLQIKNAEGTVLRTLNMDSAADNVVMPAEGSWPYLPKGDYTVSGTYTLSGVTEKSIAEIAFSVTEDPVIEMKSVTAYTSYSKYLAGDASGANSLDGSTIYNVGATITVSDAILNNANYPSLSITDNDEEVSAGNLTGRSWGTHTIKASFTLDGVTVEGSVQVEVTGIPYSYNFVDGSLDKYRNDGWATNGKLRASNETLAGRANTLVLNHRRYSKVIFVLFDEAEKGFVVSPKFHIPAEFSVQPCILRSTYHATDNPVRTGYVGAVSNQTSSNTGSVSYTTAGGNSTSGSVAGAGTWMNAFTISPSSPYISLDCDDRSKNKDLGCYYFIHEAHFRYAE